jgi:uncharacterized protein (DUF427 family)
MRRPERIEPGPGQESVWDYPRPPRLERTAAEIEIHHNGMLVARSTRAHRLLETSHPPSYYLPPQDFAVGVLRPSGHRPQLHRFLGLAVYFTLVIGDETARDAAWAFPNPNRSYAELADHVGVFAWQVDQCTVDGETVTAQHGDDHGGWITSNVVGPFKGGPGSRDW